MSARKETIVFDGSTTSRTAGPARIPARISPITTGTKRRPRSPSSGPPRPARTIATSVPKLTAAIVADGEEVCSTRDC
jgi:hypothetical protein